MNNQATAQIKKEVDELKKIVFLIIASLMVLGLVLPGCTGEVVPKVTIAICGPMNNVQGVHMWNGATLAEEEINALNTDQGIQIGTTYYQIDVIKINTNEIAVPADAGPAMEAAITNKGAQFVVGGFRTEGVVDMVKVARCTTTPFMICGAATYSLLSGPGYYTHPAATGTPYIGDPKGVGYEYIFRITPFNDVFLVNNSFLMTTMVAKTIEGIIGSVYGFPVSTNAVKIAILSESLAWADAMTESARGVFSLVAPYVFNWPWELAPGGNNGTGVWRVSDNPSETVMQNILSEIDSSGAHIIFTILSGPVGVTYGKFKGAAGIAAISVGINVEAQDPGYWAKTKYQTSPPAYGAEYEITMATWAPGVNQTDKTYDFLTAYYKHCALDPLYTASSYDGVWAIAKALDAVNVIEEYGVEPDPDQDAVIAWLEDPTNAQDISTGTVTYYPLWDGTQIGYWKTAPWPALNSTQIDYYYLDGATHNIGYDSTYPVCNFTMPPYTTHDLVYGPTWVTGLAAQWQEVVGPQQIGVWPNEGTWQAQNAMSRYVAGINWTDVEYDGITDFVIPDWMCTAWTGSACP
jgi:branched-chain amino acid transport system substrate-binding protein